MPSPIHTGTPDPGAAMDQAAGLRRMLAPRGLRVLPLSGAARPEDQARIAAQLGQALARIGRHVTIVDQSRGAVASHWGLRTRYELGHALSGDRTWRQVLQRGPDGVTLLPASRGLGGINDRQAVDGVLSQLYHSPAEPDIVILNMSGSGSATPLADPAGDWLFTAGAGGLMPAYSEMKRLAAHVRPQRLQVLVEGAADPADAHVVFGNLAATARRFLDLDLYFCGNVPRTDIRIAAGETLPGALCQLALGVDIWRLRTYVPQSGPHEAAGRPHFPVSSVSTSWS